ncbi:class I SAM-dependent methyltransferase [Paenibacillus sp. S-38]|uniref:class I SAM-dependent methyltransferase n=1 Tax=Paenibacillus sp. S-38 TaxID=3416710 RepID=UPI003CEE80E7
MIDKYELLLSMKVLQLEIAELTRYARECSTCYGLLKEKLEGLCAFMTSTRSEAQWNEWGSLPEIRERADGLRDTSVRALCEMEKYQSVRACSGELDLGGYMAALSQSVHTEMGHLRIGHGARVLFVGAGAFPLSAMTIARELDAEVVGIDIDPEAVSLAEQLADASGMASKISFSGERIGRLPFAGEASHVIVASLVENKAEVLRELQEAVAEGTRIVVRYGNGLKSVFNYPFTGEVPAELQRTSAGGGSPIYDTVVLERLPRTVQERSVLIR